MKKSARVLSLDDISSDVIIKQEATVIGRKIQQIRRDALDMFWKLSNGKKFYRGFIYRGDAIEESKGEFVQLRDDVGATTILWQKYIEYTVHQQRENEDIDEAIDRH
ncbi:hypothetical protein F511_43347 [Dorcoceras hygrometricum]|uniref:Uncharacterized protein n=1 Tax=Dorcoceras hygrometricum TaxID=472368 RepID=A0A2Z7CQP3_9LAMI|nr:hypothetical protein F511_43347 [Dorcoceras hygrometricum]